MINIPVVSYSAYSILRKTTFILLLGGLVGGGFAAENTPAIPAPTVIPRALPVEKEKKPGLFQRLFKKKPTPTPVPVPTATATPKPKIVKKKTRNTPTKTPNPVEIDPVNPNPGLVPLPDSPAIENTKASSDSTPLPQSLPPLVGGSVDNSASENPLPNFRNNPPVAMTSATPAPSTTATPLPPEIRNNPMNQPIALVEDNPPLSITPDSSTSPEANLEKDTVQRIQFRKLKEKALEDAKLLALKQKTENAASPGERYAALKEYYPKLFASMRKIDEAFSVQIDEMEAAARRRLERMEAEELSDTAIPSNQPAK